MSDELILQHCAEAFPGIKDGQHQLSFAQIGKLDSADLQAKQLTLAKELGFPDKIKIVDARADLLQQCANKFHNDDI
jgi:hypothetical protein